MKKMKFNNNYKIIYDDNFFDYASKYYKQNCGLSLQEYNQDIKRICFINKIFEKYETNFSDLNSSKIYNIIVITINIFGKAAIDILYYLTDYVYHDYLTSILWYYDLIDEDNEFVISFGINSNIIDLMKDKQ